MLSQLKKQFGKAAAACLALFVFAQVATAQDRVGMPTEKGLWLQEAASEQAAVMNDFQWLLLIIIAAISAFVIAVMFYVMVRYRAKANPNASKFGHNTALEVVWTIIPIIILVGIGSYSFPLLYFQETIPDTEFAIKATGNQWNWTYSYPDHGDIEFTSILVPDSAHKNAEERAEYEADLTAFLGKPAKLNARLLDTDTRMVIPADTNIKILLAASDVIHAWTVPAFGVKMDAVPGRVNETWIRVDEPGTYYGQCSELCGKDHAFMPIAVEVLSREDFAKWIERAKQEYAAAPAATAFGR